MAAEIQAGWEPNLRFCVRPEVAIEDFGDRSLVLLCQALQLRAVDVLSRRVLALLDGTRTMQDIAHAVASECGGPTPDLRAHVAAALLDMERQGIVRRRVALNMERPEKMSEAKYLVNPEVSFRPEDDDGGILFNVETDALEVLNPVAVEIWKCLAAPRTSAEVVAHLCAVCADAHRAQVEKDVAEFIESLRTKGFIGVVEPVP